MGWTSYHATHYDKRGRVDRKAECDAYFMEGLNAGHYNVKKSALVGSVYYAAVEGLKRYVKTQLDGSCIYEDVPESERNTFGVVFLTSVDSKNYYNFYYKDIDESMGPYDDKCPVSIISLLSPTENKWANDWRNRCIKNSELKKDPKSLKNLPVGSVIRFMRGEKKIELYKHPAAYQFKRPFWFNQESGTYMPLSRIPTDYEVVGM